MSTQPPHTVTGFDDPMSDWQMAGLAFLLFKGGLNWGPGSYENEGRANIARYRAVAKGNLIDYLDNVRNAMDNDAATPDKPLQKLAWDAHMAIWAFVKGLNENTPWTYCGTVSPEQVAKLGRMDAWT
jgi:hypothetical protein